MRKPAAYFVALLVVALLAATSVAQDQPAKKKPKPPRDADVPRELLRGALAPTTGPALYESDFSDVAYGATPPGWRDLGWQRPSRNWAVDANAFLRLMVKRQTGTITYDGALSTGGKADELRDVIIAADFKKTEDPESAFGLVARLRDANNYYLIRFVGTNKLELLKVKDNTPTLLGSIIALDDYTEGDVWRLTAGLRDQVMTAILADEKGRDLARVDARDDEFSSGRVGLRCTTYAAAKSFRIHAHEPPAQPKLGCG